jgi:hypothetical protein
LLKEAASEIERLRGGGAIIKMPELLQVWLECLKNLVPRTKRGNPGKDWERQIVWEATMVAYRYADTDPSNADDNLFRNFVPDFYKHATGKKAKGELTGLIKEALADSKRPERSGELSPMDYAKNKIVLKDWKTAELVPIRDAGKLRLRKINRSKNRY